MVRFRIQDFGFRGCGFDAASSDVGFRGIVEIQSQRCIGKKLCPNRAKMSRILSRKGGKINLCELLCHGLEAYHSLGPMPVRNSRIRDAIGTDSLL